MQLNNRFTQSDALTNTEHVLPDFIEIVDFSFLWGMDDDHRGSKYGEETPHLAMEVETLVQ